MASARQSVSILAATEAGGELFRFSSDDPEYRSKLNRLLREFGVYLPELCSGNFSQLLDNLLWRKTTSARKSDSDATLQVLLDLGEGDEVLLATIRAGEISTFRHTGL
jgi:hypothetical protein